MELGLIFLFAFMLIIAIMSQLLVFLIVAIMELIENWQRLSVKEPWLSISIIGLFTVIFGFIFITLLGI